MLTGMGLRPSFSGRGFYNHEFLDFLQIPISPRQGIQSCYGMIHQIILFTSELLRAFMQFWTIFPAVRSFLVPSESPYPKGSIVTILNSFSHNISLCNILCSAYQYSVTVMLFMNYSEWYAFQCLLNSI